MKTYYKMLPKLALALLIMLSSVEMNAQINILDRVKRKAEQRANRKIDEKIDEGLDTLEGKNKKKEPEVKTNGDGSTVIITEEGEEVEITPEGEVRTEDVTVTFEEDDSPGDMTPNTFTGSFLMEFTESKGGKVKEEGAIHYHVNTYQVAFQPIDEEQKEKVVLIYDKRDRTMISKVDDGKTQSATKMKAPKIKAKMKDEDAEAGKYTIDRTGETKKIEGYTCEKYIITTEDGVTEAWVTDELQINLMQVMGGFVQAQGKGGADLNTDNFFGLEGMVLEAHTTDEKKGTVQDMYMRNIVEGKVDESIFSTEGYEVMDITNFGIPFKN